MIGGVEGDVGARVGVDAGIGIGVGVVAELSVERFNNEGI